MKWISRYCLCLWFFHYHYRANAVDWLSSKPSVCATDENFTFPFPEDNPVKVYYKIVITDLYDISEERMEFSIQLYVFEFWKYYWPELKVVTSVPLPIPSAIQPCLWQPDLIFPNCKTYHLYAETIPNCNMRLLPDGYVSRFSRFHLVTSCQMDFKRYPMDTQRCGLNISMFASFKGVELNWIDDAHDEVLKKYKPNIDIYKDVAPLQFTMDHPVGVIHYRTLPTGTRMRYLVCFFIFRRQVISTILNTYIPSFLVVCLSFVSFWLDVHSIPGRVTLGVTALLTLATQIVHARNSLPQVSYMTAMDIWLFGCLVLVVLSLGEFTMAQRRYWKSNDAASSVSNLRKRNNFNSSKLFVNRRKPELKKLVCSMPATDNLLDRVSRILFPLILVGFTVSYWIYF